MCQGLKQTSVEQLLVAGVTSSSKMQKALKAKYIVAYLGIIRRGLSLKLKA